MAKTGRPVKNFAQLSKGLIQSRLDDRSELLKAHEKTLEEQKVLAEYRYTPSDYAREVLRIEWWAKQREIAEALIKYGKVLVRSSHLVGKSYCLAGVALWAYHSYNPLNGIILAPTHPMLKEVLFAQMRQQAPQAIANDFRGHASPLIQDSPTHYITGLSPSDPTNLQGRHGENTIIIADEAVAIDYNVMEAAESLYEGINRYFVCSYNPTDSGSYVYMAERDPEWHLITVSALEHPNVRWHDKYPEDPRIPIPGAITATRFNQLMRQWSSPIAKEMTKVTDVRLPGTDEWVRPGPVAEARLLGRWASEGFTTIWNSTLFDVISDNQLEHNLSETPIRISCDPARFGDDFTAIAVECGGVVLELLEYNGLDTTETTNLLRLKAQEYSQINNQYWQDMEILVDENGPGWGVVDQLYHSGMNVHPVDVNRRSDNPDVYYRLRDQLWFETKKKAEEGSISLSLLDHHILQRLKGEYLNPRYTINAGGQIKVESKLDTKKRTKEGSPNMADAINLLYGTSSEYSSISVSVGRG